MAAFSTAYGLSTPRAEHWDRRAACRYTPDIFFADDGSHASREALHICVTHCPVLAHCGALAASLSPSDRRSMILAGVAYDHRGGAVRRPPHETCARCQRRQIPPKHGNLNAADWHRARGEKPCGLCRKALRAHELRVARREAARLLRQPRSEELSPA